MKYLVAALMMLGAAPAFAAEPDICYAGELPEDAIITEHFNASPFLAMDRTLTALYIPRALCGFDVKADISFWRSYYTAFGCSPDSEVARLMEAWLIDAPGAMAADFATAKAQSPERVAALCKRVSDCVVPETYDIKGDTGLYCPSLGE
ncbi:MAG: hypothetical protein ACPGVA_09545 [Pikeienuella sp.]